MFACACWDGYVRIYQLEEPSQNRNASFQNQQAKLTLTEAHKIFFEQPVLCFEWSSGPGIGMPQFLFVNLLNGDTVIVQVSDWSHKVFYNFSHPAVDIFFISAQGQDFILHISMHNTIHIINANFSDQQNCGKVIAQVELSGSISAVDYKEGVLAICYSQPNTQISTTSSSNWKHKIAFGRLNEFLDNKKTYCDIDNPLSTTGMSIRLSSDIQSLIIGSVDGRITRMSVTKPNPSTRMIERGSFELQSQLLFKAHREESESFGNNPTQPTQSTGGILYPVGLVDWCYHHNHKNIFVSGGGNGKFIFWDAVKKSKNIEYVCPGPITSGKMSPCGRYLAYGIGDDWSRGVHGMANHYSGLRIFVHTMSEPLDYVSKEN